MLHGPLSGDRHRSYCGPRPWTGVESDGANGPFARSLAVSVRETGLEIGKLFRLVREDVAAASALVQETFVYDSLPGEDFYFSQPDVK